MPEMEQEEWVRQEGRGCGGALGETGGALTRSCLLWSEAAACCELECVLARGLRDSLLARGGLAEGGLPFVVLKGTA